MMWDGQQRWAHGRRGGGGNIHREGLRIDVIESVSVFNMGWSTVVGLREGGQHPSGGSEDRCHYSQWIGINMKWDG